MILLTGATGYVGGRLLKVLEERRERVRCLARRPEYLRPRVAATTEVVAGDVLDPSSLERAMVGIRTAYYMVHSMGASSDFEALDRQAAHHFVGAATAAGVERIIYLGGIVDEKHELSPHLRSRVEVGEALRGGAVPAIELRASIVIGSGSLSFEIIRALVERLPFMITPRWVSRQAQPIAIDDLLEYLCAAKDIALEESRIFEVGGADRMSYADLMREYARQRGLRRVLLRVPVLTPRLSSLWLGLVTPVYARIGRKLVDSIKHPTVVREPAADRVFDVRPMTAGEAVAAALRCEDRELAATRWSDALSASGPPVSWGGTRFGNRLVDSRTATVATDASRVYAVIESLGGDAGWYCANWLWRLRGGLDLLLGGVGLRRGRRDPDTLRVGDVVDWWRVERMERNRSLRLVAEMRLPGRAWLEFEVEGEKEVTRIRQTAVFDPVGLFGHGYWYLVYPLHSLVFRGMLRGIARQAEAGGPSPRVGSGPGRASRAVGKPDLE